MGAVIKSAVDDTKSFASLCAELECNHPDLRFARFAVTGAERAFHAEHGGMRIGWIYEGEGEVYLAAGFRTKEGDGVPLPAEYIAEATDARFAETLAYIEAHLHEIDAAAAPIVQAVLNRRSRGAYVGDCANELWKLKHVELPWSENDSVIRSLQTLYTMYRGQGYSVKTQTSWERVMPGDQIVTAGAEELRVRGHFSCLTLEKPDRSTSHVPQVTRLRFLKDSSGGCNFDFDPFRRLPLTWYWNTPGETGDGLNFANSHVVNIAKETSPTHFHPAAALKTPAQVHGHKPSAHGDTGAPQNEMYLVLDPEVYALHTYGRSAQLLTIPDLHDLRRFEQHDLQPGDLVYIPAGTGHRGIDAFVNVITLPGFKPYNEFYIDQDVGDAGQGSVPCNSALFGLKNYVRLDDVLAG